MKRMHCCQLTVKDITAILLEKGVLKAEEISTVKMSSQMYSEVTAASGETVAIEVRWEDSK